MFQFLPVAFCPIVWHHSYSLSPSSCQPPFRYLYTLMISPISHLLWGEKHKLLQSFLTDEMLQSSNHLYRHQLELFRSSMSLLVLSHHLFIQLFYHRSNHVDHAGLPFGGSLSITPDHLFFHLLDGVLQDEVLCHLSGDGGEPDRQVAPSVLLALCEGQGLITVNWIKPVCMRNLGMQIKHFRT